MEVTRPLPDEQISAPVPMLTFQGLLQRFLVAGLDEQHGDCLRLDDADRRFVGLGAALNEKE